MPAITNDWAEYLKPEYKKPYYKKLFDFVGQAYATETVYPPADDIFNAFHTTPLSHVKCVIIGQDPYHEPGQAHGLSFSVKPGVTIPPSLVNIYQELHDDLGCKIPNNGYLEKWADQGVLMLNAVLTVQAHRAGSHQGKGWEHFTDAAIRILNEQDRPIVFILWGAYAQCLYTGASGEASRSARPTISWLQTESSLSTGRSRTFDFGGLYTWRFIL